MKSTTYQFVLPSITCISCIHSIESQLKKYQHDNTWIQKYAIDLTTKTLSVTVTNQNKPNFNYSESISNEIEDIGFRCIPLSLEEDIFLNLKSSKDANVANKSSWIKFRNGLLSHWFQGGIGTVSGFSLLALSLFSTGLPLAVMLITSTLSTLLTIGLGFPSYYDAFMKLWKAQTLTMDTLFTVSTLTILVVSTLAFFVPWLPRMFEAGLLVFGFRHIGLAIEESIKKRIGTDRRFQHRLPRQVTVLLQDEQTLQCPLLAIKCDDILVIKPGEIIPVDGVCLTESSLIYETIKTGSPLPRSFKQGESVISGMTLADDSQPLKLNVTARLAHSYLARLDKTIEEAQYEKAPIEEAAGKMLQYFIPGVIAFAIVSGVVISLFFSPATAIRCAISVLVSACPCTLGLVVPLAVKFGLRKAAKNGVEFKSAKKIQDAAAIDAVVFDLHGTLTMGTPVVSHVVSLFSETDEQQMIAYAATVEQKSKHPMAKAICEYAQARQIQGLGEPKKLLVDQSNHSGIQGIIGNDKITIGNEKMMVDVGTDRASLQEKLTLNVGENIVYIAQNDRLLGYFILADPLRNEAQLAVYELQKLGIEVHICTGADKQTANRYAALLGIPLTNVAAAHVGMAEKANDHAKTNYIQWLRAKKLKVAMLGDADNDALALAQSNFGIAIKSSSSSEITEQQAGAIIQSNSLLPVVNLFAIAKQTVTNIKQNLAFSLSYNTAALLIAGGLFAVVGFVLNPGVGPALMILQMALILGNAYRFKAKPLDHLSQQVTRVADEGCKSYQTFKRVFNLENDKLTLGLNNSAPMNLNNELVNSKGFFPRPSLQANLPNSPTEPLIKFGLNC